MTGPQRRSQLLDVGGALFAERSLDGTSVEEVAARAAVSEPVVHGHSGGEDGLFTAVVDREVGLVDLAMARPVGPAAGPGPASDAGVRR